MMPSNNYFAVTSSFYPPMNHALILILNKFERRRSIDALKLLKSFHLRECNRKITRREIFSKFKPLNLKIYVYDETKKNLI